MSRKGPDVRLKVEALTAEKRLGAIPRFEPQREGEENFTEGMVFHVELGYRAMLLVVAVATHAVWFFLDSLGAIREIKGIAMIAFRAI